MAGLDRSTGRAAWSTSACAPALAFTVGMGILPVIGGFASLRLPERRGDPVYRAFAAYLGGAIVCVSLYTAVKAAYLSTVFSTL